MATRGNRRPRKTSGIHAPPSQDRSPDTATLPPGPPPGVMWPGSFDASPLSPAGEIQGFAALARGLRSGNPRARKAVAVLVLGVAGLVLVLLAIWGISALIH